MNDLRTAIRLFIALTILCGGVYPAVVTALAQTFFADKAAGSLVVGPDGTVVGSSLIGQPFSGPKYFWPRPSATAGFPYNPLASGGSNLGPINPALLRQVADRIQPFHGQGNTDPVPSDLLLASASGLDPHITPEAALTQIPRLAKARGMDAETLTRLVRAHTEGRTLGFLGEPRVNVLMLNLALNSETP